MRLKMAALALGVVGLTGCTAASKFDGTWLFTIDPNGSYGGTCVEDVDLDAVAEVLGVNNQIVDIYGADDGQVVVFFDGDIHIGPADGASFSAEYSYERAGDGWSSRDSSEISATKEKGMLVGTARISEQDVDDDGEETCSAEFDFTAELIVSNEDRYMGD